MFVRPIAVGKAARTPHIHWQCRRGGAACPDGTSRQQLKPINEYPYRRDCASAHLCDYLAPGRRKTTLTKKLLLFGGAIQLAGEVKARGERRRVRSDWMAVERERGIPVSSAVMSFEHEGLTSNLLDTPGHQDFSEDTYRTLTAVDSAVMVLDAAKGIEEQTRNG
jgi:hypothetical protein